MGETTIATSWTTKIESIPKLNLLHLGKRGLISSFVGFNQGMFELTSVLTVCITSSVFSICDSVQGWSMSSLCL